jgi:hypothetical protein
MPYAWSGYAQGMKSVTANLSIGMVMFATGLLPAGIAAASTWHGYPSEMQYPNTYNYPYDNNQYYSCGYGYPCQNQNTYGPHSSWNNSWNNGYQQQQYQYPMYNTYSYTYPVYTYSSSI